MDGGKKKKSHNAIDIMSLSFLMFNFVINLIGLFTGNYSRVTKVKIFIIYTRLTVLFYFYELLGVRSIKFLNFQIEGFEFKILHYLFGEIFVRGDYYFKSKEKRPIIFDCGSHIGLSVIFFKFIYPDSTVFAFEPDPEAFDLLRLNIKKNKLSGVHLYNCAVTARRGKIIFYKDSMAGSVLMSTINARGLAKKIKVKTISFSNFLKNKDVDFVKIDIEGGEFKLISDLLRKRTLQKIPEMVIEYHHNYSKENKSLGSFLYLLEKGGFEYQTRSYIFPLYQKYRFQDILVYAYNKVKNGSTARVGV